MGTNDLLKTIQYHMTHTMPLTMYYPRQSEKNHGNSVRIASILVKWRDAEMNWMFTASVMKMKFQHQVWLFCRTDATCNYDINAYLLITEVAN